MTTALASAYAPETIEQLNPWIQQLLAPYLAEMQNNPSSPVLPWREPHAMLEEWPDAIPESGRGMDAAKELLTKALHQSNHLHHPRYVGHQVSAPLPLASFCDMLSSFLNNGSVVYEMGAVETAIETNLTRWLAKLIGYDNRAGGIFTSGGSLGNLTALLAARQAKAGNVWKEGYASGQPLPCILVSAQAHYCVKRSAQIMGLGEEGVMLVPVDKQFRMDVSQLEACKQAAEARGRQVIAVVASNCSTATGSFDPIPQIADFCEKHQLWLHVDAAHGGATLLSEKYRYLLEGIERADSIVWDMHKMMLMPALISVVMFRDLRDSYRAFAQDASYLYDGKGEDEWFNLGHRTLECTKEMMAFKAYVCLQAYGVKFFADYLDKCFDLTRRFAELLKADGHFELAVEPAGNIICFRYRSDSTSDSNALQMAIRQEILRRERFYIVQTLLGEKRYLRCTVINPLTTEAHLQELIAEIHAIADSLEAKQAA
jgi:L-2,4-diaminobutyrate decarboxylase